MQKYMEQPSLQAPIGYQPDQIARQLPPSPMPIYDGYVVVDTDNAIVISDIEMPDHDLWMLRQAAHVPEV